MTNIQEVVGIVDRSGSMAGKVSDTIGGLNSAIQVLKDENDDSSDVRVSMKLFDHEEFLLFRSIPLKDVRPLEERQFMPRGQTALLDAMGNTLQFFMEKKLGNPNAYDSCVIYVATDGYENASKFYSSKKIKDMISNAKANYNIKVLYLGANQDAIMEANKFGIDSNHAINYSETPENVNAVYRSAAAVVRRARTGEDTSFTPAERQASQVTVPQSVQRNTGEPPLVRQRNY
jgi:uncharacterized protein YegL